MYMWQLLIELQQTGLCSYSMGVRTNSDAENYYYGLNGVSNKNDGFNINMYYMINVIFKECEMVSTCVS